MKWYGEIAYSMQVETEPHVWEEQVVKKPAMGDLLEFSKNNDQSSNINTDISLSNQLSIVMDPFLQNNFQNILYVTICGSKWTVSSVKVRYPRLLLSFGKLYKEENNG
jgi:hypothetical protein